MSSLRFEVRKTAYSTIPAFGQGNLPTRLENAEILPSFPLLDLGRLDHESASPFMDRPRLEELLSVYNRGIGNPLSEATRRAILADGRFLITGQQTGLLLGPLYTFLKAVTVISLAQRLQASSPVPLIPVFWLASEDHDILEINHCTVQGKKFTCEYSGSLAANQTPQTGDISVLECREALLTFLHETLPANDFQVWVLDTVSSCSFESYSRLFAELMSRLFKERQLVLADPMHLRALTAPVAAHATAHWPALEAALAKGSQLLAEHGIEPPLAGLGVYAILDGKRVKCRLENGTISFGDYRLGLDEGAAFIRDHGAMFSPGAALRPVVQDAVMPVLAYIGGPTELTYLWQIHYLYEALGVTRAKVWPRLSATFIEQKIKKAALRAGIYPDRLFQIEEALSAYRPNPAHSERIKQLQSLTDSLGEAIGQCKNTANENWVAKAEASISYQLTKLIERLTEQEQQEEGLGRTSLQKVAEAVMPGGHLQERVVSLIQFLGWYGPEFIDQATAMLDPTEICHQVVEIETV